MTTNTEPKGPTVTPDELKDVIIGCTYTVLPNKRTTICQLTLKNGYTVEGQSACVDARNYNRELGEKYSRQQAEAKIWPLLGFLLAEELSHVKDSAALSKDDAIYEYGDPEIYIGTKVIHAVPMTRIEYIQLRGWELPEDEDGSDQGYLVQYANGQATNVEGFSGYISWSPKDVFEESYKPVQTPRPSTYVERMQRERLELHERLTRLQIFTQSDKFHYKVPEVDQEDLLSQVNAMKLYVEILDRRLERAKSKS